ncbi:MAG: hypothetical protein HKN04_05155 [Rhodothermaceae bacterium]|nr:hypothetical protein [Rhodothermaceae bacterium]
MIRSGIERRRFGRATQVLGLAAVAPCVGQRPVWEARTETIPSGLRYQILDAGGPLSFRDLFGRLETDADFAKWYAGTLSEAAPRAFFWEHPPLTAHNFDDAAEFVLIESSSLAQLQPDPQPFEDQFARHPDNDVIVFPNLGGDALLVVPTPVARHEAYPHLAAFLRGAPKRQVRALWKAAAQAVHETLGVEPRWLSTAGLGVSWLHLRLDTRPKYYRFAPYKASAYQAASARRRVPIAPWYRDGVAKPTGGCNEEGPVDARRSRPVPVGGSGRGRSR